MENKTMSECEITEEIIKKYLEPIQTNPNVESVLLQDSFSCSNGLTAIAKVRARFNECFGGWTHLGMNTAGQPTYFKANSFFGGVKTPIGDPGDPIQQGEIRELVVVTLNPRLHRYEGEVVVVRAWSPMKRNKRQTRPPSIVVRGLNCLPLLLPDTQRGGCTRRKKSIRIRGCNVVFASVSEALLLQKGALPTVTVYNGQHLNALATWVVTAKEPKGKLFLCQKLDLVDFRAERAKICKRIDAHLEQNAAHPNETKERIEDTDEAFLTAVDYLDTASIVGVLDLVCAGAFDGISISMLSAPREFPLFLCCCVVLATFPTHYRLNLSTVDDEKLSHEFGILFHSNLQPCYTTTSQTALEIAVQLAIENVGTALVVPEHMRRQGLAVISELLGGHAPGDFNMSSIRASNRSKMLTAVLRTIREVDDWCHTGIFNGCRESAENNDEENDRLGGVNHHAMSTIKDTLLSYFSTSVIRLANVAGIPFFAVRPNTKTKCGDCGAALDVRTTLYKGICSNCSICAAFFCDACHHSHAAALFASGGTCGVKCVHCLRRVDVAESGSAGVQIASESSGEAAVQG